MKRIILLLLIVFFSCTKEHSKKELLGNWYSYHGDSFDVMTFSEDSLTAISRVSKERVSWGILDNYILLKSDDSKKVKLMFDLDTKKNILTILKIGQDKWGTEFKKAKNFNNYFEDLTGIELEDKINTPLLQISQMNAYNVYINYQKGTMNVSSDFMKNIDDLRAEFEKYRDNQRPEFYDTLNILIFKDKSIEDKEIEKIIEPLKTNLPNPIYKIYKTNISDFDNSFINWNAEKIG